MLITLYKSRWILRTVLPAVFILMSCTARSSGTPDQGEKSEKKGFNAGEMIMEHIGDAHSWEIAVVGKTIISIPLPVILLDEGKLSVFMSSRFHHGHSDYKGFRLCTEGSRKGKIIKVKSDGTVDEAAALPLDFSITKNVMSLFISILLICLIFIPIARKYSRNPGRAPRGLQSMLEPLIIFVRDDIVKSSIGPRKYQKFLPYLLTLFFFIFLNNLLGIVPFFPGGANLTGNIAVTMVLAVITFLITSFNGSKDYWKHIINAPGVPWWLKFPIPLMPIVEIVGIFTKPFVLMIRLFANITAGHIIALGFISLIFIFGAINTYATAGIAVVSILFYVFMGLLELLVAFIQAYVFTLLTSLFIGMAMESHEHTEEHV